MQQQPLSSAVVRLSLLGVPIGRSHFVPHSPTTSIVPSRFQLPHLPKLSTQQHHIEDVDDGIDLAELLEHAKNARPRNRADYAPRDQHATHRNIDTAASVMGNRARHARAGDLGCGRSRSDRRRDAVEDEQRRRQKPTANAEHARQQADPAAQEDDDQRVDRQVRDGKVDIHRQHLP